MLKIKGPRDCHSSTERGGDLVGGKGEDGEGSGNCCLYMYMDRTEYHGIQLLSIGRIICLWPDRPQ